jgi:hypothetical protein
LKFEREDWTCFRTVEGLQQKAGVATDRLRRLALKELADNGLDEGGKTCIGEIPGGGYFVEDDGRGIDGTPEDIARLFSIARPMVSTKLLRLPTRGALGNGLRVVAGAVLASQGTLVVITRNLIDFSSQCWSLCVFGSGPDARAYHYLAIGLRSRSRSSGFPAGRLIASAPPRALAAPSPSAVRTGR